MENLTHSLLGATLAELALPNVATPAQRRMFFALGIAAANLPDADLLYTQITMPPLGYLLHHRGHTHTLVGIVGQALLIGIVCLLPFVRRRLSTTDLRARLALLIVVILVSHLTLDWWNSYGIHPFWPFDTRWFYGDAIFIVEPWLWLFLGVAVVTNAHRAPVKRVLGTVLMILPVALTALGMIGAGALTVLAVAAAAWSGLLHRLAPRTRSVYALAAIGLFVTGMFYASRTVRRDVIASMSPTTGVIVDVILNPESANPLCWNVLAIVKHEGAGEYLLTSGSAPLAPGISTCGLATDVRVQWVSTQRQSLDKLRTLYRDNCQVRAWMQFGRAPVVESSAISDARYGGSESSNFSSMLLAPPGSSCPKNLTDWTFPRADLL